MGNSEEDYNHGYLSHMTAGQDFQFSLHTLISCHHCQDKPSKSATSQEQNGSTDDGGGTQGPDSWELETQRPAGESARKVWHNG